MENFLLRTEKMLRSQLELSPENLDLKLQLAEVVAQLEDLIALSELMDVELIRHALDQSEAFDAILSLCGAQDSELALSWVESGISSDKSNAFLYWRKAELLERMGRLEDAAKFRSVACVIDESFEESPPTSIFSNASTGSPRVDSVKPGAILSDGSVQEGVAAEDADEDLSGDMAQVDELLASIGDGLPKKRFDDVGGMQELKNQVRMKILLPFEKPEIFKKFNKKAGGGVLLYGPPGCGKTLLARAAAGEANLFFGSLGIPEVLSKWMGESEQRIHSFFETARRQAPSLLFIDEIDALGAKRSEASSSMATLVNVLLTEIDGATSNNENVFILAATNMPWRVDSAFRRPGRFDQVIFVPPPDFEARKLILEIYLKGLPLGKVDLNKIAKITEKYSGADLESLVSSAAEDALLEEMNSGRQQLITTDRILRCAKKHRATTLEWLEQATNYASFANSSGLYDDLAKYLDDL